MKTSTTLPCSFETWTQRILLYSLVLSGLLLSWGSQAVDLEGRLVTINLDGSMADWQPATDTMYSATEISVGAPLEATITNICVANDTTNLYVALQTPADAAITNTWTYNLYIDIDGNGDTGFDGGWMVGGYDRLVQFGASGTSYSVHSFNGGSAQGTWDWTFTSLIEYSYSDNVIELAIPLSALGANPNRLRMEFNVTGGDVTTETWAFMYETGASTYTLANNNPPVIEGIDAGGDKVRITFSKPVDATAEIAANYTLSGLTVSSAARNPLDFSQVTLTTSPQTRGTIYTATIHGVKAANGIPLAPGSQKAFVSTIFVDGLAADWDGIPALYSIPEQGSPAAADFKDVYVYNDADHIYFRLTLWAPSDLLSWQNNLFFDTDNDPWTGNLGWGGSELLIQSGAGYQEKNGGFNEGAINGLGWQSAHTGMIDYEFRISRAATYNSDGLPVFTADAINFAFGAESEGATVNRLPQFSGTIPYTFLSAPVPPPGPLMISNAEGQIAVSWTGPGRLQSCTSLETPSWTDLPDAQSPYTTSANGALYFRLVR